jgi:nicotinate-nucleotide adenylyltransferase
VRIAIFGGTFNPVHTAHITMAKQARESFGLDEVWFVPASHPPHKTGGERPGYEHRFRMVELACGNEPGMVASRLEEGNEQSFSIKTIERVKAERPGDEIFFLIGADAFAEITTWMRWREVIAAVEFIVVARPGHEYTVPEGARVRRLDSVSLAVSSSEIRQRLRRGEEVKELPRAVLAYVREQGLYREASASKG